MSEECTPYHVEPKTPPLRRVEVTMPGLHVTWMVTKDESDMLFEFMCEMMLNRKRGLTNPEKQRE